MDIDRLIHDKKHFAELDDADIEVFLRERKFRSEHLNVEFKALFPQKRDGKYDIKKICKYIVGFSNEEGGLVIYGVADGIRDPKVLYPDYVPGLSKYPSLEDLSLWLRDRIHPLTSSPAIRFFKVREKEIAVLKVPSGVNKPYCYHEPDTRTLTFFKKTAGGITEINPDELSEMYRTQIIEQAQLIVHAASTTTGSGSSSFVSGSLAKHSVAVREKLEDPNDFGLVQIYSCPMGDVKLSVPELKQFVELHRWHFSESMRYSGTIDVFQKGVSVGYFPSSIRQDVKSTVRISLYDDGCTAFDALADMFLNGDHELHAGWLCYELQRHLQLTKAVLAKSEAKRIRVRVQFEYLIGFHLAFARERFWPQRSDYTGSHEPIEKQVDLGTVHDYDGPKRNVVIPVVQEIIEEVSRIFGLSAVAPNLWDQNGKLTYVNGLENQR